VDAHDGRDCARRGHEHRAIQGTIVNPAKRMEGKEYVVKDGDLLLFKFNV